MIKFTSERAAMSVVVKEKISGKVILFTKGSEESILKKLNTD